MVSLASAGEQASPFQSRGLHAEPRRLPTDRIRKSFVYKADGFLLFRGAVRPQWGSSLRGRLYIRAGLKQSMPMIRSPEERRRWIPATFTGLTLLILLLSAPLQAATHPVGIYDFYFVPMNLLIFVGDTVTWHNFGTNLHSTMDRAPVPLWDSGVLDTNEEYSFTFTSAGTYAYLDKLHTVMKGSITVMTLENHPPSVSITNPLAGATFIAPMNLLIQATASDSDGTVAQVEFFANANSLGLATNPPFRLVASNLTAGAYALTAVATDNGNATTTSSSVSITVKPILKNPARPASNRFQFDLTGVTIGKTNILYASTDMQSWLPINTNLPSTTVTNLADLTATNRWRFYRVMQMP